MQLRNVIVIKQLWNIVTNDLIHMRRNDAGTINNLVPHI